MARCTKAQKLARIQEVYNQLLEDTPRASLLEFARINWGVKRATVDNYISLATDLIVKEGNDLRREAFAHQLVKLKMLRHQALQAGDMRLAFDVLREQAKLLNLYPIREKRIQNLDIDLGSLTTEQLHLIANGDDPVAVVANDRKTV